LDSKSIIGAQTPFFLVLKEFQDLIFNENLLKLFLYKFDLDSYFAINQNEYLEILNYGTISA
jgi:hypothetical protein